MGKKRTVVKVSEVRRIAALQCTQVEAAAFFGMSQAGFRKLLAQDDRVKRAWEEGRERGKLSLRRKQFNLAETNAQMAIHLGKQYLEQSDRSQLELSGPNGGPIPTDDLSKLSADERKQLRTLLERTTGDPKAAR